MTGPKTLDRCPVRSGRSARRRPSISRRRWCPTTPRVLPKRVPPKRHPSLRPRLRPRRRRVVRGGAAAESVAPPASAPVARPWIVAPVSGAVAAALVIGVGWMLGWPPIQPASAPSPPQLTAAVDGLTGRVAGLEVKSRQGRARSRRRRAHRGRGKIGRRAAQRAHGARARKARSSRPPLNDVKSAPRSDGAASPDLAALGERLAKVEEPDADAERRDRAAGQQARR